MALNLLHEGKYIDGMTAIREAADEESTIDKIGFIAFGQYMGFSGGAAQALSDLRKNAEEHPRNLTVRLWLARALSDVGNVVAAVTEIHQALQFADNESDRVKVITILSNIFVSSEQYRNALDALQGEISSAKEEGSRGKLYLAMATVYETMNPPNHQKALLMYELALRSTPGDNSLRFNVAYTYSDQGAPTMALFHYRNLLARDPQNATALNNAGVAAGRLSLPIASIDYYRQSEKLGETLAMANLAFQLIQAGFIDEATEILEKAQHSKEPNQRVLAAIGEIARSKQAEENMLETLIENSKKMRKWNQRHAEALLESTPDQSLISGLYDGGGLTLELHVDTDNTVVGNFSTGNSGSKTVELNGELEGAAITFSWKTVKPKSEEHQYSYLSSLLNPQESGHGLLIVKNSTLAGYRVKGEWSLDARELSGWSELTLTKRQQFSSGK